MFLIPGRRLLVVDEFVAEGFHIDPDLAAAIEVEARVEALGFLRNRAEDGPLGPVSRSTDGAAKGDIVARQELEVGALGAEIYPRVAGGFFGLYPDGHPHRVAVVFLGSADALAPPHPRSARGA